MSGWEPFKSFRLLETEEEARKLTEVEREFHVLVTCYILSQDWEGGYRYMPPEKIN